ncbi:MAG: hypothetical protein ABWY55_01530, partial [Microbacterium sp.]
MRHGRLRLVPPAAGAWAIALWAVHAPDAAPVLAAVLWALALGVLGAAALCARLARPSAGGSASRAAPPRVAAPQLARLPVASLRVRARHALAVCVLVLAAGAAAASSVAIAQPARTEVAALAL